METVEKQFEPVPLERRRKSTHYKWKSQLYKRIALGLAFLLAVAAYCLCMAVKGNHVLKGQLADSETIRSIQQLEVGK